MVELIFDQFVSLVIVSPLLIELVLDVSVDHLLLLVVCFDVLAQLFNLFHDIVDWLLDRPNDMLDLTDP